MKMNSVFSLKNEDVKLLISRLKFTFDKCFLKLKLLPPRTKKYVAFSVLLVVFFYFHPLSWLFPDSVTAYESLLDTEKCPACFGSRVCDLFYYGQIKMSGKSKYRMFDYFNLRNVYYAQLANGDVIVKKMATSKQLTDIDNTICQDASKPEGCDVTHAFPNANWVIPFINSPLTLDVLKETTSMVFACPSRRLLDTMWTHFQEYDKKNEFTVSDRLKFLYTSMVNPESIILQTFPKSEGWPFPQYFGACGRAIVVENAGEPLSSFYFADFAVRVALAYELMIIADALTYKSDYRLYMTDVTLDNFVVDFNGKITYVDLEHIAVVDTLDVKDRAPDGWDTPHKTKFYDCREDDNCMVFKTEDLCNHELSDHNYNAICRLILSQYANDPDYPGGLLHSMPVEASKVWDLEYHLNACANPRPPNNRYDAKDNLIKALKGIMDSPNSGQTIFKDMEKKR